MKTDNQRRNIRRRLLLLLSVLVAAMLYVVPVFGQTAREYILSENPGLTDYTGKVIILHTNDVHGEIDEYAYLKSLADAYENLGARVVIVDAGDYIQGSAAVADSKGESAIRMMAKVGYDVVALGNHEFDYGQDVLKDLINQAKLQTFICANIKKDGKPFLDAEKAITHVKVSEKTMHLGFVGIDTPQVMTQSNPICLEGLDVLSGEAMFNLADSAAKELKEQDVDLVFCLGHLGINDEASPNRSTDMKSYLEAKTENGVDFLIDGHSHSAIEGTVSDTIPLQQAATKLEYIGVIQLGFNEEGKPEIEECHLAHVYIKDNTGKKTQSWEIDDEDTAALAVKALSDEINAEIDQKYATVIGTSKVELSGVKEDNRSRESNNGDFVSDAILWYMTEVEPGSITKVDSDHILAITNGGNLRDWIHAGDVTKKDIFNDLPFGNTLCVIYVKGSVLLDTLEASTFCVPGAIGGFPQVAGMQYTIDITKAYDPKSEPFPGSTYYGPNSINRVTINSVNGKPFDPEATYAVVTNDFVTAGGDTYYEFKAATDKFDTGFALNDVVEEYLVNKLGGVIDETYAQPQGRIIIKTEADVVPAEEPQVVVPGKQIKKVSKGWKKLFVNWKKAGKATRKKISGYQLRCSTDRSFDESVAAVRYKTVKGSKAKSTKITKLKKHTKYYVQLRTYKTIDGKKYYSEWSETKSKKTR